MGMCLTWAAWVPAKITANWQALGLLATVLLTSIWDCAGVAGDGLRAGRVPAWAPAAHGHAVPRRAVGSGTGADAFISISAIARNPPPGSRGPSAPRSAAPAANATSLLAWLRGAADAVQRGELHVTFALVQLAQNWTQPSEGDLEQLELLFDRLWDEVRRTLPSMTPRLGALTFLALAHFARTEEGLFVPHTVKPTQMLVDWALQSDIFPSFNAIELVQVLWSLAIMSYVDDGIVLPCLRRLQGEGLIEALPSLRCAQLAWSLARFQHRDPALLGDIWERLQRGGDGYANLTGRGLANVAWAYAKAADADAATPGRAVLAALAEAAVRPEKCRLMNTQDVCNMAYAYALLDVRHSRLMDELALRAMQRTVLAGMTAQGVSNLVWAYARLGIRHPLLFEALKARAIQQDLLPTFTGQGVSLLLWGFTILQFRIQEIVEVLSYGALTVDAMRQFSPQALATVLWALATAQVMDVPFASALARVAVEPAMLAAFNPQDLANAVWAIARLRVFDARTVYLLANRALEPDILPRFNSEELSMAMCGFARMRPPSVLMLAMANRVLEDDMIANLSSKGISNVALAFAKLGLKVPALMAALTRRLLEEPVLRTLTAQGVTLTVRAWALLNIVDEELMNRLAERAMHPDVLANFNAKAIVSVASAFSAVNVVHPGLMGRLARRAMEEEVLFSFDPNLCADLIYAYRQLGIRNEDLEFALERAEERWFTRHRP